MEALQRYLPPGSDAKELRHSSDAFRCSALLLSLLHPRATRAPHQQVGYRAATNGLGSYEVQELLDLLQL